MLMMAPSRHSSSSSVSSETAENECFTFIVNKLIKYQPINLNTLSGHFSVLPKNVRNFVGKDNADIKRFLKSYPDTFKVNGKGKVSLLKSPKELGLSNRGSSISSGLSDMEIPPKIEDGEGVITRLFAAYGFFEVESPIKASVYFSASCFSEKTLLNVLRVGQRVGFNAKLGQQQNSAQYRATDVWLLGDSESDTEELVNQKVQRNVPVRKKSNEGSTGNMGFRNRVFKKEKAKEEKKPVTEATPEYCVGKIQNIYDTYGFISKDNSERVFFHLNTLTDRRKTSKNADLRKFLKKGDPVHFYAIPSKKKTELVVWEATSVWIEANEPEMADSGDELFVSTSDDNEETPVGSNVSEASRSHEVSKNASSSSTQSLSEADDHILNCQGMIYPNSDNTAEIKFGTSFRSSAIAESCNFYINGSKVSDLMWEFNEKAAVQFDAVKVKIDDDSDFYWKAVLVWVGRKPPVASSAAINQKQDNTKPSNADKNNESKHGKGVKYTNWGDTPYSEDEEEIEKSTKEHAINNVNKPEKVNANLPNPLDIVPNKTNIPLPEAQPLPNIPVDRPSFQSDNQVKTHNDEVEVKSKQFIQCEEPVVKDMNKNIAENDGMEASGDNTKKNTGVYMFQKLKGQVTKMNRYLGQITCDDLQKSTIPLLLNELYCKGKILKEEAADPRELLFVGDLIYFNGFEIVTDNGKLWQKVTLAWKGDKPKHFNKEMEPKEFIEIEKLKVSAPIPSWSSFKSKMKEDTINMLNTANKQRPTSSESKTKHHGGRKFLSAISPGEHAGVDETKEDNKEEEDEDFDERKYFYKKIRDQGVPDSLVYQFTNITNSMNSLRRNFASFATLKEFDQLALDINDAIDAVLSHLTLNASSSSSEKPIIDHHRQIDERGNDRNEKAKGESNVDMTSTASQTLVTGDVIARDLFPQ